MYDDKIFTTDYGVILPLLAFISIATLFSTTGLISRTLLLRMVIAVVWYVVGVAPLWLLDSSSYETNHLGYWLSLLVYDRVTQ